MKQLIVPLSAFLFVTASIVFGQSHREQNSESAPAAIPVITQEEADRINEEILERNEPLHNLYKNSLLDKVSFEGTIRAVSSIPDPQKSDYPNCLYTVFVEIDALYSDSPLSHDISCEIILNVPIFKNNKTIDENIFMQGDRISCVCAEYDTMPQEIQEIQLSDDIQSYEHQQYYAISVRKIETFRSTGNRDFAKRVITILPIQELPKDKKAAKQRKERIQNEIDRIEEELEKHGGSFEKWKDDFRPIKEKYDKLCKEEWEGWINDSFFSAYGPETTYNTKKFIEGILPYKEYLEDHNIDFIVLRIPSRGDFAARVLASEDFQENPAWVEHYYECLKNDIEIVDPMPEMWKQRFNFPMFYYYHQKADFHPFEGFSFVAAEVLSDVLKRYDFKKVDDPITLEETVISNNAFWPSGNAKNVPGTKLSVKSVFQKGETIGALKINTGSPFLFLSNSYFKHPKKEIGASVPGYTAYFIQSLPDWMLREGSGNTILRLLFQDTSLLSRRKAVIMGVHPTAQWQGFPRMPKYLLDKATSFSMEKSYDLMSPEISVIDNSKFIFSTEGTTTKILKDNNVNQFAIELSIPECENISATTCVVRFNFEDAFQIGITARDPDNNSVIDFTELAQVTSRQADLYIPAAYFSKKIRVDFRLHYPDQKNSIKNIELWYY